MLRRSFVAASGSLCLAPAAAAVAAARPEERAPEAPLLRTVVTNLPASLPPGVAAGTRLVLKRAPERSYDPRSIAAFTRRRATPRLPARAPDAGDRRPDGLD
jgi:hypothetical protein